MEIFKLYGSIFVNTDEAKKSISDTAKNAQELGKKIDKTGQQVSKFGAGLTKSVTLPITGLGAAAVKVSMDFESSMSQVAAISGATGEELDRLSEAARDMGSKTKYSASEAADALTYLSLAGYDTAKSIDTLPTILNLAAAGGIELADASDMVTDAMSALGSTAGTAEEFVDKMAVTSQKSNTSVAQLGDAILKVGATAKSLAGGTTELNTVLGILADNGTKGAEGGTRLRNIMLALATPIDKASEELDALGVSAYDASTGKLRPLQDTLEDLNAAMADMTEEQKNKSLNTIFNKVDLADVNYLLGVSADRWSELSGYISDSEGAASEMAATMSDNLEGQLKTLQSQLEELGISFGEIIVPVAKDLIGLLQKIVDGLNKMSPETRKVVVEIGLFVAALGPVITIIGNIISMVGKLQMAWGVIAPFITGTVIPAFQAIAAVLTGPILVAIGLVIAAIAVWKNNWEEIKEAGRLAVEELGYAIESLVQKIKDAFAKIKEFIKLPHFSIDGSLSLNPPSVPKLKVDWYAKAMDNPMVLTSPTVFGVNKDGSYRAGGEAGSEVVGGTDTLMGMMQNALGSAISKDVIVSAIVEGLSNATLNINADLSANSDKMFESMRVSNANFKRMHGNSAFA